MYFIKEYTERNPNKKNTEWANKVIRDLRYNWAPLIKEDKAKQNMEYLLNTQSNESIRDMFKDPDKTKLSFINIAVFEKYRNILIAERDSAGVFIGLNTLDPTVVEADRESDRKLMSNRKTIEAILSTLNAKIGDPPYKLRRDIFKGNIESFDDIGLNDEEDDDLNYFFGTHWRLVQEIKGEIPLNYYVIYNKLEDNIDFWCNDILAKKRIACQCYLNHITGAIDIKYLAPEQVKAVMGESKDYKDALAIGYEKTASVQQLLKHLGNEFDPETDWQTFINSVNHYNAQSYTGISDEGGAVIWCDVTKPNNNNVCGWSEFLKYRIGFGYIEFKSIDSTAVKNGTSVHGNDTMLPLKNPDAEIESEFYEKVVYNNEVTYKAYFIPISAQEQRIYRFGKLFHQTVEGAEDEFSNYSISVYQQVGPTAVDVIIPYINIINQAWTKFEWMVRRAKPRGRTYNWEALVQIASRMIKEGTAPSKVAALMEKFEEGINDIYTIPTVNGEKVGGGMNPYFDKPNGLDPTAKEFLNTIVWVHEKIASDLGINEVMAGGYNPAPNEGYRLQLEALKASRNATEYISRMILKMLQHVGTQTLLICQNVIKYKESIAYKFLINAVGADTVAALEQSKFAHHRLGIFVDTFNVDIERQEMRKFTQEAYLRKEIDYAQMMLINAIDNPKKAGMTLAYEKRRQEKLKMKEVQIAQQNAMALQQQKDQGQTNQIMMKGNIDLRGKSIEGGFLVRVAQINADAQIKKKEMDGDNTTKKVDQKTQAEIDKEKAKQDIKNQQP